ncbi:murein hydrolase activator EnvC family protein [Deinococcus arcticus]|uniref:Peptidase M23 n=1 Tax=Deinococcus arcticus TaxID=2136176 RepID=A0A2T3WBM2_9DEIO|nr:M23 family metallopeptidase [Deinococcus arcticus]PTA69204.1 peptidase M23 [Deinococcus arcticus]
MTRRARAGALLAVALLCGVPQAGLAQTTSERLQTLERELQQQRELNAQKAAQIEQARRAIASLSAQQRQTLGRLDELTRRAGGLENELATATARVALAERALADTGSQLKVTQARVERLQGDVRQILRAQYRDRSGRYLQLLSQSRSLSDLLIRLQYANRAGEYNTRVIETLAADVQVLREQRDLQTRQARELRALQVQRQAKLRDLQARRTEQNTLLSQLRSSEQGQRTLAAQRQAEQALAARTIDQLVGQVQAEQARLEAERQRRLEEERRRREAEARRIREEQERARQEAARLARIRAEQERLARERQAAAERAQAERAAASRVAAERAAAQQAQQRLTQQRQREAQLQQERAALQQRQQQVQAQQQQVEVQLAPLPPAAGPLGFPLPGGRVSAPFGSGGSPWVVLSGATQVVAAQDGNVLTSTFYASLGGVVLVDHGALVTVYLGLREKFVNTGDRVSRGTPLGTVGGSSIIGPDSMAFQLRRGQDVIAPPF